MCKRLFKNELTKPIISVVISVIVLLLSIFGASRLNINKDSEIWICVLGFIFILAFACSLIFLCFMLGKIKDIVQARKKKAVEKEINEFFTKRDKKDGLD